jgi:hypothetical protein
METLMQVETVHRNLDREPPAGDAAPTVYPAAEPLPWLPDEAQEHSTLGLVELILKEPGRVDTLNREEKCQAELMPRFLGIALASYTLYALAMILLLNAAEPAAYPHELLPAPPARLADGSAVGLWLGYNVGLVAATGICLPTFYFFGLLVGVRMSMLQVAAQVLRGTASNALLVVGLLPIYVAVVLGMVVFKMSAQTLEAALYVGLALPFLAGVVGVQAIYRGVMGLAETLPPERRCRRACFLRRLTLSWAACYLVVSPVMIYRLWEYFAGRMV